MDEAGCLESVNLEVGGHFTVECFDRHGNLRWRDVAKNIIPNVVLNDVLNVYFGATAATVAWYMGLVDNSAFSAFNATDTMASHSGWTENVNYSQAARQTWTPGSAASQSMSNGTACTFSMTPPSGCTIKGFFLTSSNTIGGTSGLLAAEAALTTPQACNNGDTIKATYTINATTS